MVDKIKITKKEFEDFYEVADEVVETIKEIEETNVIEETKEPEPEFLTVEEQEHDRVMHQDNPEESKENA